MKAVKLEVGLGYWTSIDYVSGAYWRSKSQEALKAKARDIRKRLSGALEQLTGYRDGIIHIGIETSEGDDVEIVRSNKIMATLEDFDLRGKPLEWLYLHFFRGESPLDEHWAIDETCHWRGGQEFYKPLRSSFVVSPYDTVGRDGVHWAPRDPFRKKT